MIIKLNYFGSMKKESCKEVWPLLYIFPFLLLNQRKEFLLLKAFACQIGKENSNYFYVATSVRLEKFRKFI